jgi:GT2 family glycosyltransferase
VTVADRGGAMLGVVTYNRPHMAITCLNAVKTHLVDTGVVERVFVYDDHSTPDNRAVLDGWASVNPWAEMIFAEENRGVGYGKNRLLTRMLYAGARWLFLAEDDVMPLSAQAVTGYIHAGYACNFSHLAFHGHGTGNSTPTGERGDVTFWPAAVGAWCMYSRRLIQQVGMMDEGFHNAWEHVEHTLRCRRFGLDVAMWRFPDATGSEKWLVEQPGALVQSVIRKDPSWHRDMAAGRAHWADVAPDTYREVFG